MRDRAGWRAAVWVLGTAGIYSALYGFAAGERTPAVVGVALAVVAVVGGPLPAALHAWWSPRRPSWVWGTGEVETASGPPDSGAYGTCDVRLLIATPGLGVFPVQRSVRLPVSRWPGTGDTVPVRVDARRQHRIRVEWDQLGAPPEDADTDASPPWRARPATGDGPRPASDADPGYGYNDPAFDGTDGSSYYPSPRLVPLEDEPSRHTDRFLFPTERFRGEWRRHWVRPLARYAVTLGLAVGAQFLIPRFVPAAHVHAARTGVAVAGGLIALHVLFAWEVGRLVLTNRRVMLVEGVIRRRVSTAPLPRAGDLRLECSLAGRLLHYGDFVFERKSVFSRMRMVAAVPRPNELYLRVVEEVYEPAAVEERFNFDRELEDL
ncbi:PH domain-containing protein [Actinoplanes sp. NPDC051343]|uniref:PH domain-containing protein n=1 Tax=Actinoplanes sp. NPDC051343 TaxID=3363906 RepID=UPI0037A10A87